MGGGDKIMANSIDQRIVNMQFNNSQFEKNIGVTQKSLDKLNEALKFNNASKGFQDINKASGKVNLAKLASSIETVASRFSTLGIIGVTALQNITNKAVDAGFRIANALTSAITAGGKSRALNLEAAEFQITGLLGEGAWDKIQDDINYGVKDTAYGLDAAAKVASQLAASEVQIGDNMKTALRSISGVAAMTNSSYEDIGSIYTTVAGNGRLMSEQLLQLSSRGLNAAATLGKYLGKSEKEVRDMVSKGKIDFATFAAAMDNAFGEHAKDANKTFEGALSNMKASLSRFGAAFYTPGLENMRDIFNALTPIFDSAKKALTPLINEFNYLFGFFTDKFVNILNNIDIEGALSGKLEEPVKNIDYAIKTLIPSFKNIANAVKSFIEPIKSAFSSIFPPIEITRSAINKFTYNLRELTSNFILTEESSSKVERIFKGVFAVVSIGITVVKALANAFKDILGKIAPVGSSLLDVAAAIGDFLVKMNDAIKGSSTLSNIFSALVGIIGGFASNVAEGLGLISRGFSSMISGTTDGAILLGERISTFLGKILMAIKDFVVSFAESLNFKNVFDTLNSILTGGFLIVLINFVNKLKVIMTKMDKNQGIVRSLTNTLKDVQSALFDMQNTLKSYRILTLAAAIGILAFSLVQLSRVDAAGLASGLTGITGIIANLVGAMYVLSAIELPNGGTGIYKMAGLIIALAISVNMLSKAVVRLSSLDLASLAKGLVGVGILCAELSATLKYAEFGKVNLGNMIGLIALAEALNIMSSAVTKLSSLDVEGLIKGLGSVAILLAAIVKFTQNVEKSEGLISTGIGLIAIATAINILAKGLSLLGNLSIEALGKSLASMGAALFIITKAIKAMPENKSIMANSVALIFIAESIKILAKALSTLGSMSLEAIAKSLLVLGGSLYILCIAVESMEGAAPGARALIAVSAALVLLAPALSTLGSMSLISIAKSFIALAGAFYILGTAAEVFEPVIPAMYGLSGVVALLGVGLLAAGAGILAFSLGLSALAASGAVGISALISAIEEILKLIPRISKILAEGFISFLEVMASSGQTILNLVKTLITSVLNAIIETIPLFGQTLITLINTACEVIQSTIPQIAETLSIIFQTFLQLIIDNTPLIVEAGINLIFQFIQSIADNAYAMGSAAISAVSAFLDGVASQIGTLINSAINFAISFINGVADGLRKNKESFKDAIRNLISAVGEVITGLFWDLVGYGRSIIDGLVQGIQEVGHRIGDALTGIVNGAIDWVRNLLGINSPSRVFREIGRYCMDGMAIGIEKNGQTPIRSAANNARNIVKTFSDAISNISDEIDTSMDFNPTITPIIDLSDVDKGVNSIDSMLGEQFGLNLAPLINSTSKAMYSNNQNGSETASNPVNVVNNYDMTQNNYSPKALSQIDIYRQTKNQFSRLKRVVNV